MKKLFPVLLATLLFSCDTGKESKPMPVIPDNSTGEYYTVFLFEIEGTKVYRFYDSGEYRYLAIGPNVQNIQATQSRSRHVGKIIKTEHWDDSVIYAEGNR
jgi:hypothetical protein